MSNGRPNSSFPADAVVELEPLSYQSSSEPVSSPAATVSNGQSCHSLVRRMREDEDVAGRPVPEHSYEVADPQDRNSLSSSVTDISYNKISVREPLARVLAMDHTYTEVDEERVSSFYEEIAGPAAYAKVQRPFGRPGATSASSHTYSQPEPVYSSASIADPGYEAVGGSNYPDSEPGYEAITARKRDDPEVESEPEPGYEVITSRKTPAAPDSEPGYEAIPERRDLRPESEPEYESEPGYEAIPSRQLTIPDPEYEVIKRSPEPLPPTPNIVRQESDLSADPGYERVRFVPRFPSDDDPDDPVYAKIEKTSKNQEFEERFCERL